MQDNPYQSPADVASARPRRRLSPPPVLHYAQIVGAVAFFGILGGGAVVMQIFPRHQLSCFLAAGVVSVLLGLSICLLLERRRRREERNAPERPDRDLQAWRRH